MISKSEICTLIPAAGRGSRLGGNYPKVFTPITSDQNIWTILNRKLHKIADNHCLVLNSIVYEEYKNKIDPSVKIAFQDEPVGMGDAIFQGFKFWSNSKFLIIVWGDQVHVSDETLKRVSESFDDSISKQLILPLVAQDKPYVEYVFENKMLKKIKQEREGDLTTPGGLSDMGVFGLSVDGLLENWNEYLRSQELGRETGEVNCLPFLSFLSCSKGWNIQKLIVDNVDESRGINTPEDLEYFRNLYRGEQVK